MGFKKGTARRLYTAAAPLADTTNATIQAATWTQQDNVQSSGNRNAREDSTITIRKDEGTDVDLGGKSSSEKSFQIAYNTDDPLYDALATAYDADADIALADMDGPIDTVGSKGIVGNYKIKQFDDDAPESGAQTVQVTVKPTEIFTRNYTVTA